MGSRIDTGVTGGAPNLLGSFTAAARPLDQNVDWEAFGTAHTPENCGKPWVWQECTVAIPGSPCLDAVQRLVISNALGGEFTVTVDPTGADPHTTAPITYPADDTDVQTAVDALPNVDPGDLVVAGGPTDFTFTYGGQYACLAVSPITVDCSALEGAPSYDEAVLADEPAVYWPLGDVAAPGVDVVAARNLIATGAPTFGAGPLRFDGDSVTDWSVTDYLSAAADAALHPVGAFTLEAIVDVGSGDVTHLPVFDNGYAAGDALVTIVGGHIHIEIGTLVATGPSLLTPNTQHHIAVVADGANAEVLLDGLVEIASTPYAGRVAAVLAPTVVGFSAPVGTSFTADGRISDAAVYPAALSIEQVDAHVAAMPESPELSCAVTVVTTGAPEVVAFDKPLNAGVDAVEFRPFIVEYNAQSCGGIPGDWDQLANRAKRGLAVRVSNAIALALSSSTPDSLPNQNPNLPELGTDVTPEDGPIGIVPTLEALIAAVYDCGLNGEVWIHAPAWLLPVLLNAQLITQVGSVWKLGPHTVVVDQGFANEAPTGADPATDGQAWLYATGPFEYATGPVNVLEDTTRGVTTRENRANVIAAQLALYRFDPCCVVAALTEVPS